MEHWARRACILFCVLVTASRALHAQVDPMEQLKQFSLPQAPPALFSTAINDASVELFLQGSWKTFIGGYLATSDNSTTAATFPGFTQQAWSNSVDFLLSLWVQRHYFFQAQLSDGFTVDSISLGYANIDGPGLNKLMIGNTGIEIPSYPYIYMGKAGKSVPGLLGEWSTASSRHYAMLRLLNRNTVTQQFLGTASVTSNRAALNSFIHGRFFQLPYTNLSNIEVWVQDGTGTVTAADGFQYRQLSAGDFQFINPGNGTLGLFLAVKGRVLVSYKTTSSSQPVAFPSLANGVVDPNVSVAFSETTGSPFEIKVSTILHTQFGMPGSGTTNDLFTSIGGSQALIAYVPGIFSVFEDLSWYLSPQGLNVISVALDSGTNNKLSVTTLAPTSTSSATTTTNSVSTALHLVYNGSAGISQRYPLASTSEPDGQKLYLPSYQNDSQYYLEWTGSTSPLQTITLNQDPLPESIQVTRNGLPETAFTWSPEQKALIFIVPIQANEAITVTYDLANTDIGSRVLQFEQANTWAINPDTKLDAAVALDWPIDQPAANTNGSDTGRISAGSKLGFAFPKDSVSGFLSAGALFSVPGAGGSHIIQDYSGASLVIQPDPSNLLPAAPALNIDLPGLGAAALFGNVSSPDPSSFPVIDQLHRGKLLYKAYLSSDGNYNSWDSSPSQTWEYTSGNPVGPSIAASSANDPFSGQVAVADYTLTSGAAANGADENWVSFEIALTSDQQLALAQTGNIWFYVQGSGLSGGAVSLYAQAGSLAEDLDGDGTIAKGLAGQRGFIFNDGAHNTTLNAAYGFINQSDRLLSEDLNNNNILDPERSPLSVYLGKLSSATAGNWYPIRIQVSPSNRYKLQSANAIRFFAVRTATGTAGDSTGRILVGDLHLDLPGLAPVPGTNSSTTVNTGIDTTPGLQNSLAQSFPKAVAAGSTPSQAVMTWSTQANDSVQGKQVLDGSSIFDNRYHEVYLLPSSITGSASFKLRFEDDVSTNGASNVAYLESPLFPLTPSSTWVQASFDVVNGTFSLKNSSGSVIFQGTSTASGNPQSLKRLIITVQGGAAPSTGTLYVDSIMSEQGIASFAGHVQGGIKWAHPAPLVQAGSYTVVSNVRTESTLEYIANTQLSNYSQLADPGGSSVLYSGSLGSTLSYVDILTSTRFQASKDGLSGQASYALTVPSGIQSPLVLRDAFSSDIGNATPLIQKETGLSLNFPGIFDLEGDTKIGQYDSLMQQDWKGSLNIGSPNLGVSTSLETNQSSQNFIDQVSWNQQTLPEKVARGYQWYSPLDESAVSGRISTVQSSAFGHFDIFTFAFSGTLGTNLTPGGAFSFGDTLDMKTVVNIGAKDAGVQAIVTYDRLSTLNSDWNSSGIGDDIAKGANDFANFSPAWRALPFVELFDSGSAFSQASAELADSSVRPQLNVGIARPLDPSWLSLVIPKQINFTLARNLARVGGLEGDNFVLASSLTWNGLNQFGRQGMQPLFGFYDTDQLDGTLSGGVLEQNGVPLRWQLSHEANIVLFGLSFQNSYVSKWKTMTSTNQGLIDLMPPDQLRLSNKISWTAGDQYQLSDSAGIDLSWYVEAPTITFQFLNRSPKGTTFIQNVESIQFGASSTGTINQNETPPPLVDLLGANSSVATGANGANGAIFAIKHSSYLVLPGLAYISLQLSLGYYRDYQTSLNSLAVQLYAEAKIVF